MAGRDGLDGPDTLGVVPATLRLPEQIESTLDGLGTIAGLPEQEVIENVVLLGAGDAGIAARCVAALAEPFAAVPLVVCETHDLPSFVSDATLCIALSRVGEAEETLEAAEAATVAGARLVVVTGGGPLAELAHTWHAPVIDVDREVPTERAAFGSLTVPAMVVLEQVGLWRGARDWVRSAAEQVARRRDQFERGNGPVVPTARTIGRTIPLVYGAGRLGAAAARRWKAQCNKHAKIPAFWAGLPELTHDEIAGWGQHGDLTRQVFTLVQLRHDDEHPQVMRRFELMRDLVDEVVHEIVDVPAEGDGTVAQLFDLVFVGDLVSLQLAADEETDPGPVPAVHRVETGLVE